MVFPTETLFPFAVMLGTLVGARLVYKYADRYANDGKVRALSLTVIWESCLCLRADNQPGTRANALFSF